MKLTCPQLRLLAEGKYSICPGCGDNRAYLGFRSGWECANHACKFFSLKRAKEVGSPIFGVYKGIKLPEKGDWADLGVGRDKIVTKIAVFPVPQRDLQKWPTMEKEFIVKVVTEYNTTGGGSYGPFETMVQGYVDEIIEDKFSRDLDGAIANHVALINKWVDSLNSGQLPRGWK